MGKRGPQPKHHDGISAQLRWYRRHRERILAALRAAPPKEKKKSAFAEEVIRELGQSLGHGFAVTNRSRLDHPKLHYLDARGRLHVEEECSAEELIRRWKKAKKKNRERK